jgi:Helicase HerA, central domain
MDDCEHYSIPTHVRAAHSRARYPQTIALVHSTAMTEPWKSILMPRGQLSFPQQRQGPTYALTCRLIRRDSEQVPDCRIASFARGSASRRADPGRMVFNFGERTKLGTVFTHAGEEELALTALDRMNHMLVIGKTGMGKTRVLRNIIVQDIHTDRGVGVIDPHGDLQNELLDEIPRRRTRDLVYLDPNDPNRVVTLNVIAKVPRDRIAPTASEIVGAFKAV